MATSFTELTRVARLVLRVLRRGAFDTSMFPGGVNRHGGTASWQCGIRCHNCGASVEVEITEHAMEDAVDVG